MRSVFEVGICAEDLYINLIFLVLLDIMEVVLVGANKLLIGR